MTEETCPISGLPVTRRPEWTDMPLDEGYWATVFLLGDHILVGRPSGYATQDGVDRILSLTAKIVSDHLSPDRPYIHVQDYTRLSGASVKSRTHFSDVMKKRRGVGAVVFCLGSPWTRIAVQLAKRLHGFPYAMYTVKDYRAAVRLAAELASAGGTIAGAPAIDSPRAIPEGHVTADSSWELREADYMSRFEIVNGDILHSLSEGYLEEKHIGPVEALREKVLAAMGPENGYFYVAGVTKMRGMSGGARRAYLASLQSLYRKRPFRMFILYGANTFMRAAATLARPLTKVRVRLAGDLAEALDLIEKERRESPPILPAGRKGRGADGRSQGARPYVEEILQYLGRINWEEDGLGEKGVESASPSLQPVFDAIDLIKKELDDLFHDRRQAEAQLNEAKVKLELQYGELKALDRMKDALFQDASHELKTPVAKHAMQLEILESLRRSERLTAEERSAFQVMEESVRRQERVVRNLLDLSRLEAGRWESRLEPVRLDGIVKEVLNDYRETIDAFDIDLTADLHPLTVESDRAMLWHVFSNLIHNAVKFRAREGRPEIAVRLAAVDDGARVSIADNGIGMTPEEREKVFNKFYQSTASSEGSGVGLSICKRIVEQLGGRIRFESEGKNSGATASVTLPLSLPPQQSR